jgi:excisionase family DNA binding protein
MKQERIIPQRATYTTKEAAAYLNVSVRTIRNFITRGLLRKSHALRRRNLIRGDDVETFLSRTC